MNDSTSARWRVGVDRLAVVLGVCLLLAGGVLVGHRLLTPSFTAEGAVPSVGGPSSSATNASAGTPTSAPSTSAPSGPRTTTPVVQALVDRSFIPDRLGLNGLRRSATVQPVDVEPDGQLTIPQDPNVAGWWSSGAAPGSPVGTVVVAGHVDSAAAGPGALFDLARIPVGSKVVMSGQQGSQTYVVQARRRYLKQSLPWRSLFAQGERPRLVLVTCGGDFDYRTRHYTDNVVVFATPVAS